MLCQRTLVLGTMLLAVFLSGAEAAQAGLVNHAMRWMGWGYSDGYHAHTPGWEGSAQGEWIETLPAGEMQTMPGQPTPAVLPPAPMVEPQSAPAQGPPKSTRLPRNMWMR